ncbi:cytochrome-c oxidase, cbb3-type subunit I [Suttonella sp. R2A3]|uniref:cytochrome-c oxidase, cbb3-type subunit I n=1 Tax=Suttonella sp. R2A3 TaxID=2908648 RepID=UPI001F1C11CF|nr:cytochrome-c oxidase, cbb3-type subunit I [Suttonella sp. R2A3]UJF23982.1 cytochrome-c oxidase, cbb3-type subunit I [Suttonella sp. R2A3]
MTADTTYNYRVVKQFTWAAIVFGVIGMLVGVFIAAQQYWPDMTEGISFLAYGRLRPLHTNAVIFAFGGNALFATSYYAVQRTCGVRLISDKLAAFTFYGFNLVILGAVLTYPFGFTQGKEYAELIWPLDILLTVVWVAYAIVFFFTIGKRKEKHIYVGLWFFGGYIIAVALLHIFNNLEIPVANYQAGSFMGVLASVDWLHSYPLLSGATGAMTQWWYGHNAVGFFLTAAFLGMMYYFVPKQAERPIYSYRLSIMHFWALISIYMWAGPHHLHYTALPDWTQTLGMVFSVVLWIPSWGGMVNGMMTLSGAWNKLITDPIIRFMFVALSFYGMSTFEGPMMAIKEVNALSHYTEWTVGHVHSGALGWVAMITMGSIYHMLPRLYGKTEMYSRNLIFVHFWLATIGIILYVTSMWVAGIMEGLMWRETYADGTLVYTFAQILEKKYIFVLVRFLGGVAFLSGMVLMFYNCLMTLKNKPAKEASVSQPQTA